MTGNYHLREEHYAKQFYQRIFLHCRPSLIPVERGRSYIIFIVFFCEMYKQLNGIGPMSLSPYHLLLFLIFHKRPKISCLPQV